MTWELNETYGETLCPRNYRFCNFIFVITFSATSWADVPNWPQIIGGGSPVLLANLSEERSEPATETSEATLNRRSDTEQQIQGVPVHDPEPANISWFR